MASKNIEQIEEFADIFFYRVIDRIKQAGAKDKEYTLPKIEFFRSLSPDERNRIKKLTAPIGQKMYEDYFIKNPMDFYERREQIQEELTKKLLNKEEQAELLTLEEREKWDKNTLATYSSNRNIITLDKRIWNNDWNTLAHELLHSVRAQVLEQPEKNKRYTDSQELNRTFNEFIANFKLTLMKDDAKRAGNVEIESLIDEKLKTINQIIIVPAEVIEIFGELERIVLPDIFQDKQHYAQPKRNYFKLSIFKESYQFFRRGVKDKFAEMISPMAKLSQRVIEKQGDVEIEETEEYKQINNYLRDQQMHEIYLELINGISRYNVESMYREYYELFKHIKNNQKKLKLFQKSNYDFPVQPIEEQKALDGITRFLERSNYKDDEKQKSEVYDLANLTINEFREEFKDSWPNIFLMSGQEVEKRYLTPVKEKLEKLKTPL